MKWCEIGSVISYNEIDVKHHSPNSILCTKSHLLDCEKSQGGNIMFKLKAENGRNNICGKNLTNIRHKKNISQRQLAKMMQLAGYDVDHHFIRRIENGERFVTDMELIALSKVLEVTIYDLIDDTIPIANPIDE